MRRWLYSFFLLTLFVSPAAHASFEACPEGDYPRYEYEAQSYAGTYESEVEVKVAQSTGYMTAVRPGGTINSLGSSEFVSGTGGTVETWEYLVNFTTAGGSTGSEQLQFKKRQYCDGDPPPPDPCEDSQPPKCDSPYFHDMPSSGYCAITKASPGGGAWPSYDVCIAGCKFKGSSMSGNEVVTVVYGPFIPLHTECTGYEAGGSEPTEEPTPPAPPTDDPIPPTDCPKGYVMGEFNGSDLCLKAGSKSDDTKTTLNPDGTTTEETKTTEYDEKTGQVTETTTTTNKDSAGNVTDSGTTTTTESQASFCSDPYNAKKDICKGDSDSQFSGDCANGDAKVTATGDAVMVAIAKEAVQRRCSDEKDAADLAASTYGQLGESLLSGDDPLGDDLPSPGNATVVDVPEQLDETGFLGGGSCFTDKTFSIQGQTVTIEFSKVCEVLIVFRYLIMVIATMTSVMIIVGALRAKD